MSEREALAEALPEALAEPLCAAICDLLGEPRILVPGEVSALLSRVMQRPDAADALTRLLADAEQRGAARVAAAVEALHFRRPWDSFCDSVTFGQTEFPDQCNHCRRRWPCETIAALATGAAEREEGCDCTELCSMGPTCPGGMLARLPGSGCWRTTTPTIEDILNAHAGTTSGGDKMHVSCRPECGWTGNDWVAHRAHVAEEIRAIGAAERVRAEGCGRCDAAHPNDGCADVGCRHNCEEADQ